MKIFISQPMNGRLDEDIRAERQKIAEQFPNDEIIDTLFEEGQFDSEHPLIYLGESIKMMSEADLVVFCNNWALNRGCRIEYDCAKYYNKEIKLL